MVIIMSRMRLYGTEIRCDVISTIGLRVFPSERRHRVLIKIVINIRT